MARLRLLLALCLIGVGTSFGALALSGYYKPGAAQKPIGVAATDPKGSQLVRTKPRQRFVAADTPAIPQRTTTTHTIAQTTTQATVEVLPWAKPSQPVIKNPPREAVRPKDTPKDTTRDFTPKDLQEKRPQQAAAVPWPWSLFSN
jgi:hypothetical protein